MSVVYDNVDKFVLLFDFNSPHIVLVKCESTVSVFENDITTIELPVLYFNEGKAIFFKRSGDSVYLKLKLTDHHTKEYRVSMYYYYKN